jgi:hypothetical protein
MRSERAPLLSLPGTGRGDRAQRGGWGFPKCSKNGVKDAIEIPVDFGIPEAEDAKSHFAKARIARCIVGGVAVKPVLPAIDLDDEAMFEAREVDNERMQRRLSAEMIATFAPSPQVNPKLHLLRSHPLPQTARGLIGHLFSPHPPCFAWSPLPVPGRDWRPRHRERIPTRTIPEAFDAL